MQEQKKYQIETDYYVSESNKVFVVSDYYGDNTLTIWGFDEINSALESKTRSDVGMWKPKKNNR